MALVHRAKKEKGKKHKTKKKTQKKQQIFRIKLRNDRFRMFGPNSKLILVVSVSFGRWPIQYDSASTTQFWLNLPSLVRIRAE